MAEAANTGGGCGSAPPDETDSFPSEEYECKICYNYYDLDLHTPKQLNCCHTICQECLDTLHSWDGRGWGIDCPMCRHRTPVPGHWVHNLPDDTAVTEAPRSAAHEPVDSSNTDVQTGPAVASVTSTESSNNDCQTCTRCVVFVASCVGAIFSFLSMVVFLVVGIYLLVNFYNIEFPIGPICLFIAGFFAVLTLICTQLMCGWCKSCRSCRP